MTPTMAGSQRSRVSQASCVRRVAGALVFSLALVLVTTRFIAPSFGYLGYGERSYSTAELTITIFAVTGIGLLLPARWRYPSHAAFAFLVATIALPVLVIPVAFGQLPSDTLLVLQLTTTATFGLVRILISGRRRPLSLPTVHPHLYWVTLLVIATAMILYLFVSTGISPSVISFSDVYAQRTEYTDSVTSLGAYAVGWVGSGILPAAIAYGLYRRSWPFIITPVLGIILLYSLTGYKSYIFGVGLSLTAYVLCRPSRQRGTLWLTVLGIVVIASAIVDGAVGGYAVTSLTVRRALSTAGINTAHYFSYFSKNDQYELRHSVLSWLGRSPYSDSPARLIGTVFYGTSNTAANASFIADGYANFGVTGCLLAGTLVGTCLRGYDKLSAGLPLQISSPALTLVLVAAANTAPLTVLATHGGLVVALVIALMPRVTPQPRPQSASTQLPRGGGNRALGRRTPRSHGGPSAASGRLGVVTPMVRAEIVGTR